MVIAVREDQIDELIEEFPGAESAIRREVKNKADYYNKNPFQEKERKFFIEEIKRFFTLINQDYKEPKESKKTKEKKNDENIPATYIKEEYPLAKFKENIKKWLHIEDEEVLEVVLAGIIGEKVGGDPLWLFLIAPPGGSKTELLKSFKGNYSYHLSDMTPKTLISGLMLGDGKNRKKVKDLLPELDGKVLIFKDFTTILEKSRDQRNEIIAQFREAYDGSFSKKVGTLDDTISYDSRFGLIAGVTPIIDKHWKVMQQLGERFLKIRWREDSDKVTKRSRENEGKEILMRKELLENSNKFIQNLDLSVMPEFDDLKFGDKVSLIAKFIAFARTPLSVSYNTSDFFHEYIPMPEMPTRLVKQLKKLAKSLALIRGKKEVSEEEIKVLLRVAKDTIPPDRLAVLETIKASQNETLEGCKRSRIVDNIKMPRTSTELVLKQLVMLELVKETKITERNLGYNTEAEYFYKISSIWMDIF